MSDLQRVIDVLTDLQNANESMYQETYEVYEERDDYQEDTETFETALSALREALERGQGCEYCEKEKRIKNTCYTNAFAEVCKHSKSFAVHMPLNFGSADCDFFINYCPMCGRKLEVEG